MGIRGVDIWVQRLKALTLESTEATDYQKSFLESTPREEQLLPWAASAKVGTNRVHLSQYSYLCCLLPTHDKVICQKDYNGEMQSSLWGGECHHQIIVKSHNNIRISLEKGKERKLGRPWGHAGGQGESPQRVRERDTKQTELTW